MAATKAAKYTKELAEHFYETMCTIRKFEESVKHDFLNGEIPGFVHLYIGEEAIATGVCSALRKDDMIESTHRGHGHCVAKGADVNRMMAEIFGKKTGLCQGRGGSMHIADFSVGMLGAKEAVARARAGEGPTFIEAKTYRIEGHFVGDPELYRDHAETQKIYHDTDPLKMFRAKAAKLKLMTAEECDAIDAKCEQKIKDAKEYAMQSEYADASEYMKYVYVDD